MSGASKSASASVTGNVVIAVCGGGCRLDLIQTFAKRLKPGIQAGRKYVRILKRLWLNRVAHVDRLIVGSEEVKSSRWRDRT